MTKFLKLCNRSRQQGVEIHVLHISQKATPCVQPYLHLFQWLIRYERMGAYSMRLAWASSMSNALLIQTQLEGELL